VTIPKRLADKQGIKPGDSITFEELEDAIVLKKVSQSSKNYDNLRMAIREFSKDIPKIRKAVKESELSLIENLSRHLPVE
jgi:AbrB family looped-hinge helix DNA binding protein